MNVRTKVIGSTLFEVLIATIISAIVVGIALSVWNIVFRQVSLFQKNYHETTAVQKLDQRLRIDFEKAQTTIWDAKENELRVIQSTDTLIYVFDNRQILRNDEVISENFESITTFIEGKNEAVGLVDAIKIDLMKDKKSLSIFISRKLTAKERMD